MFKCSECGNEYEIKPKYCDCGNDIFINVEKDFTPQEVELDEEIDDDIIETAPRHRNLRKKSFSPIGMAVFGICIILSLLVLFVIGNPKKDLTKTEIKKEIQEQTVIPSIDSYWDNTAVKIAKGEEPQPQKQENILDKIVSQIIPQPQPKKEIKVDASVVKTPVPAPKKPAAATQKTTAAKTQTQKTQPQTATSQKQTTKKTALKQTPTQPVMTVEDLTNKIRNQYSAQNQTPATQPKQTTAAVKQSAPIPHTTSKTPTTAQTTQTQTKNTQTHASVKLQTQTQTVSVAPHAKSHAQLSRELAAYKSGLRNAIGRKVDFTKVIGDGECSLSFKINSSGRLTSKAFIKQSSNITLNDAVFNALNTMTSYNPPPEGYNGETLRLNIKFYNGNFEISLN